MTKRGGKTGTQSMKNLLNSIRKQRRKPIICCFARGEKSPKSSYENGEKDRMLFISRDRDSRSTALAWHPHLRPRRAPLWCLWYLSYSSFCLFYWLLCLDSYAFVLALSKSLAWLLVEQSPRVKSSLFASLDVLCRRCWSASLRCMTTNEGFQLFSSSG